MEFFFNTDVFRVTSFLGMTIFTRSFVLDILEYFNFMCCLFFPLNLFIAQLFHEEPICE